MARTGAALFLKFKTSSIIMYTVWNHACVQPPLLGNEVSHSIIHHSHFFHKAIGIYMGGGGGGLDANTPCM